MAGCGYVCPQCEGKGWVENGETCNWCILIPTSEKPNQPVITIISDEEWIQKVHEGCACSDIGVSDQ